MDILDLQKLFENLYNRTDFSAFFAPGRVNLIGEHTDYNGGYVFPCALNFGTYGIAGKRNDGVLRLASVNFGSAVIETPLDAIAYNKENEWVNYLLGVVNEFQKLGINLCGVDVLIAGDIPGSGLSSSASIELLMCVILNSFTGGSLSMIELVKLSQRAENQFMGVNSGIMDQFASGMGKENHAILLNCGTLDYRYVSLALGDYVLILANTNKKRSLSDSKYNERRSECEQALASLRTICEIKNLCDLSPEAFEKHKNVITDPVISNRAAHVINENARTMDSVKALNSGYLNAFGKMMNLSHISLRDLYEVTGFELDTLAEAAWEIDGVLGSRMTGAGFGGCTVSIVHKDAVDTFINKVGAVYTERTGLTADFYIALTGGGARQITGR